MRVQSKLFPGWYCSSGCVPLKNLRPGPLMPQVRAYFAYGFFKDSFPIELEMYIAADIKIFFLP